MLCNYWVFTAASIAADPSSIVQQDLKAGSESNLRG